ncbi:hypothetical protein CAEBREN_11154 [Caenorhabditis brenneri]|uniref:Domain of unknown function WSN domain-containing protein n=1 Tax=Caenorhabditis brenneri TaxID=135651 RepID=G0PLG4_CAEBE|nr:hypothetical protein CAEBREN_11154 [Caenorhabditis brenneri]
MWFSILSILLITIPNLQGNEDITLPIKEIHYKISKTVAKIVEESKLLPDPSELEIAEKTKKVLEEYIPIDISSGLPEQIKLMELKEKADDVKVMEELRDSEAIQRMLGLIDKLEGSFKGIKASGLERLQWKIDYSLRKMTPIRNHLKTLEITPGDLIEPLKKIESCLQNYDFAMDFSTEEEGVMKIEEDLKEVRAKEEQFMEALDKVEKFRKVEDSLKELGKYCKEKYPLWSKTMELLMELEQDANLTLV